MISECGVNIIFGEKKKILNLLSLTQLKNTNNSYVYSRICNFVAYLCRYYYAINCSRHYSWMYKSVAKNTDEILQWYGCIVNSAPYC